MEIQIFSNSKFGQLRVALNEKGETVFCLADVCKALAIGNTSAVKRRLDEATLTSIKVCSTSVNQYGAKSVRTTNMTISLTCFAYRRETVKKISIEEIEHQKNR